MGADRKETGELGYGRGGKCGWVGGVGWGGGRGGGGGGGRSPKEVGPDACHTQQLAQHDGGRALERGGGLGAAGREPRRDAELRVCRRLHARMCACVCLCWLSSRARVWRLCASATCAVCLLGPCVRARTRGTRVRVRACVCVHGAWCKGRSVTLSSASAHAVVCTRVYALSLCAPCVHVGVGVGALSLCAVYLRGRACVRALACACMAGADADANAASC